MKKRNFYHFIECLVLTPLFFFFAFFFRMQNHLFFILTAIFTALAAVSEIVYLYIVGDSEKEHIGHLIPLDASDVIFGYYIAQVGLGIFFTVLHTLNGFSPWTAMAIYILLLLLALTLLFFPELKDPIPAPDNEIDEISDKRLQYYANYLTKLCRKCQYVPLTEMMTKLAELLPRIDLQYSVQLQTLDNDLSSKCVKIENALLTGDHSKLPVLTRELEASLAYIEKRLAAYHYILTDEGFCKTDDEIANSQIDHLLDKLGLEYEDDLPTLQKPFTDEFFYQKALLFASEEYKALLEGYNQKILDRIAADKVAKAKRRDHRMRHFRKFSQIASVVLMVATVLFPLYWHLFLQPHGITTTEDESGNLIVTGYNQFYGDELTIPAEIKDKKVIAVGRNALNGYSITSLTLEEGIERLEYQAICENSSLTYLSLPSTLKEIGHYAFYDLTSLHSIYFGGTQAEWKAITIGNNGNKPLQNAQIVFAE